MLSCQRLSSTAFNCSSVDILPLKRYRSTSVATAATGSALQTERTRFKQIVKGGEPCLGLFVDSSSALIAEYLAATPGYDWLLVDAQHAAVTQTQLQSLLAAISIHGRPSIVRVGGPDDRIGIQQALDAGAYGVMVPTVNTVADAKMAVGAAYFPPLGHRSIAFPIRPQLGREVGEFISAANGEVLVILQILAVPGVDVAFMGPFDLSFSLGLFHRHGYPGGFHSDEFQAACKRVIDCCQAAGVTAGNFSTGGGAAEQMQSQGFSFLAVGTDMGLLESAVHDSVAAANKLRARKG